MLKNYYRFIKESYKTGYFNYDGLPLNLSVSNNNGKTEVKVLYMDKYYTNLSIDIHGKELEKDEFFINPDIDKEMVNILEKEGFIQSTNKKIMAGDKETISYKLV